MRETTLTLDDVMFQVSYTPSNDSDGMGKKLSKGVFVFNIYGMEESEIDQDTAKRWIPVMLEKRLLDYLLKDDYDQVYKALKVNKLSIDVGIFEFECSFYNIDDDQSMDLLSYNIIGNTVNGRKEVERLRAEG